MTTGNFQELHPIKELLPFLGPSLAFISAGLASSIANSRQDKLPWRLFAWSILIFGTAIPIWRVCGQTSLFGKALPPFAGMLTLASFALLLEFGRRDSHSKDESYFNPSFYVPAACLSIAGLFLMPMLLFAWGAPAFLIAARAFWKDRKNAASKPEANAKAALAGACLLGGLAFCLSTLRWMTGWPGAEHSALFFDWAFSCAWPMLAIIPLAFLATVYLRSATGICGKPLKRLAYVSACFLAGAFLIPLAVFFGMLKMVEFEMELYKKDKASSLTLVEKSLENSISLAQGVSRLLAETPGLDAAITSKNIVKEEPKWLSELLNKLSGAISANSICFILDSNGLCVASSDLIGGKDLRGRSFSFRSYFKDAVEHGFGLDGATGQATQIPGIFASAAIRADNGKLLGVAVVKIGILNSIMLAGKDLALLLAPSGKALTSNNPAFDGFSLSEIVATLNRNGERLFDESPEKLTAPGASQGVMPLFSKDFSSMPGWKIAMICSPDNVAGAHLCAAMALGVVISLSLCIALAMRHADFWHSVTICKALAWQNEVMDSQVSGVAITDSAFEVQDANKGFRSMFALPEGSAANNIKLSSLFKGRRAYSEFAAAAALGLEKSGSFCGEAEMQSRSGKSIWCEISARMTANMDSGTRSAVWNFIDKTISKQAVDLIKESEERYRSIFDNAPVGIAIYDAKGPCIAANAAYSRISGGPVASLLMEDFRRLKSWHSSGLLSLADATLRDGHTREMLFKGVSTFGKKVVARCILSISSSGGRPLLSLIAEDQVAKAEYEEAMKEALARHEQLFRLMPAAAFTVDTSCKIQSFNAMAESITGYKANEVIGQSCLKFMTEPCNVICRLFNESIPKPLIAKECTIIAKDGSRKAVMKSVDIFRGASGELAGGIEIFIDISKDKELQSQSLAILAAAESALASNDLPGMQKSLAQLKSLLESHKPS